MDEICDDELMQRAATGDRAAFDAIVRRHQHRLQRFSARMLGGNSAFAADATVGCFLRLWESRTSYRPAGKLEFWLIRTAYRLCLDEIERKRSTEPLSDLHRAANEDTHERLESTALGQAVRDAMTKLPEAQRAVVLLSVYEGMTYDQIAEALDIPPGTVASRKNQAIALLRRTLTAWSDHEQ